MLIISCLILLIISIMIVLCSKNMGGWDQAFWLNIGTGIMCSLLVFLSIDWRIKLNADKERFHRAELAFRRLKSSIGTYLLLYSDMYKASSTLKTFVKYNTFEEMVDGNFYSTVKHLDLLSPSSFYKGPSWYVYFSQCMVNFITQLNDIVEKYGTVMELDDVKLIEDILQSNFSTTIINQGIPNYDGWKKCPFALSCLFGIEDHMNFLLKLVKRIDSMIGSNDKELNRLQFYDHCNPAVGDSRMEYEIICDINGGKYMEWDCGTGKIRILLVATKNELDIS